MACASEVTRSSPASRRRMTSSPTSRPRALLYFAGMTILPPSATLALVVPMCHSTRVCHDGPFVSRLARPGCATMSLRGGGDDGNDSPPLSGFVGLAGGRGRHRLRTDRPGPGGERGGGRAGSGGAAGDHLLAPQR